MTVRWWLLVVLVFLATLGLLLRGGGGGSEPDAGEARSRSGAEAVGEVRAHPPPVESSTGKGTSGPTLRGRPQEEPPLEAREGGIFGRVLDARSGTPVSGVPVHACPAVTRGSGECPPAALSDSLGRYRIRGRDASYSGLVYVLAFGAGWQSAETERALDDRGLDACRVPLRSGRWVPHDVRVTPTWSLAGRVLLPGDLPASRAHVRVECIRGGHGWWGLAPLVPPVVSDELGMFSFPDLPREALHFVAETDGYLPTRSCRHAPLEGDAEVVLRFEPPVPLVVEVVSATDSTPIPGARIRIAWRVLGRPRESMDREADEEGRIALASHGDAIVAVFVRAAGYGAWVWDPARGRVSGGQSRSSGRRLLRAVLVPLSFVSGRVLVPGELIPPDLLVQARGVDGSGRAFARRAPVGTDGAFRVGVPSNATFHLTVSAPDSSVQLLGAWVGEPGQTGVLLTPRIAAEPTTMHDGATWAFRLETHDGMPIQSCACETSVCSAPPSRCAVTDFLHIDDAQPVVVRVGADSAGLMLHVRNATTADGRRAGNAIVGPFGAEGGETTLRLPAARTLRGTVLHADGSPVQAAEVRVVFAKEVELPCKDAWPQRTIDSGLTDGDGRFEISGRGDQPLWLSVHDVGAAHIAPPAARVLPDAQDLVVRLLASVACRLSLVDADGRPVAGVRLSLDPTRGAEGMEGAAHRRPIRTDASGVAVFTGLVAGGAYDVRLHDAHGLDMAPSVPRFREWSMTLAEGWEPRDATFRLEARHAVKGVVQDGEGRPHARAVVQVVDAQGIEHEATTTSTGRFLFYPLPPGTVSLNARFEESSGEGEATARVETTVDPRSAETVLVLANERELLVRLSPDEASQPGVWTFRVTRQGEAGRTGRSMGAFAKEWGSARFRALEPGARYWVWGHVPGDVRYVYAEVGATETSVDLRVERGGIVRGTVVPSYRTAVVTLEERGVHLTAHADRQGFWRMVGVPPGRWTLVASQPFVSEKRESRREAAAGDLVNFDLSAR